jgi:hypothetical protein
MLALLSLPFFALALEGLRGYRSPLLSQKVSTKKVGAQSQLARSKTRDAGCLQPDREITADWGAGDESSRHLQPELRT